MSDITLDELLLYGALDYEDYSRLYEYNEKNLIFKYVRYYIVQYI